MKRVIASNMSFNKARELVEALNDEGWPAEQDDDLVVIPINEYSGGYPVITVMNDLRRDGFNVKLEDSDKDFVWIKPID